MSLNALPDLILPAAGQKFRWPALPGAADALALAQLAGQRAPLVVITATAQHAQRLLEELAFFNPALRCCLLPDWETLPYDHFSPHHDLVSARLATLYQLHSRQFDVAIVPLATTLYRLTPPSYLAAYTFMLRKGEVLDLDKLREQFTLAGYHHVNQVYSPGEYSVRGSLIDLFPMGSVLPYRLDLFDRELESIRTFDVDSQRTLYPVADIRLLPAREFPTDANGVQTFRRNFRETFEGDPTKSRLYKDVSAGMTPAGIEYYLPLFFDETATLFDYLPPEATLALHHDLDEAAQGFWKDTDSRYRLLSGDKEHPLLPPQRLFLSAEQFFAHCQHWTRITLPEPAIEHDSGPCLSAPKVWVERREEDPLFRLRQHLQTARTPTLLVAESLGRRETLLNLLKEYQLQPQVVEDFAAFLNSDAPFALCVGALQQGYATADYTLLTEAELYATYSSSKGKRQGKKTNTENLLRDLSELKAGDPVVHEQHGVGRYLGLVTLDLGEGATEFLHLSYADDAKLYIPVAQLHVVSRYAGVSADAAPLHKLGSGQWDKARKKAAEQVRDTAAELLNLYACRAARQGYAFKLSEHDHAAFAEGFGFEETPDQAAAIAAVIQDMTSGKPMDRLVCGDVGFGKTEVALRAAFVAVADGKQVAVLVPTTLLAEQHWQTFSDRFADWPVKVVELSRFRTAKEQAQALKGLADGSVDIVIGTHRLVQPDIEFARLGLVIIDEEHRFGVRQKEQLKALRAEVDVLTLTATPIPRTLGMALEGLRDFSVIATAPQRRLAIKTFVAPESDGVIREAVLRELKRGGQVFFLYNEVDTIEHMRARLEKLVPEARIGIGHGQMRERELETVMRDFYQQRFNLFLCTTIIETGIDVPNANTILIHRADKFGLAQLHQLRGRVGRSHHQAYAYLLTPEKTTNAAIKRLEAIQMMEELGSGFYLAMHDLEIRGAGEVLGDGQSGQVQEIGFSLYSEMLNQAVKALKKGLEPDFSQPLEVVSEINLHVPALLPTDYCPDVHERLVLYKRLANCSTADELDELHQELIDRFGLLPEATQALVESHRLRLLAKPLGVSKLDATENGINLQFVPNPPIDPMKIITLIQSKRHYKLAGPDRLKVESKLPELGVRIARIKELFKELS
ncbi:transcription-repair coupling factor [Leeia aquatica]|uniref:Transcription-repair-coupling factor n=1 Tax=Leeia aquatica TaxID=2725557 RepID=A0A847S7U3_9NEIS|nr:transcription-repair coupling factor [Leeia aquatica]NLR75833.1 transcription-repair coupling factor [Leeia aquatica]